MNTVTNIASNSSQVPVTITRMTRGGSGRHRFDTSIVASQRLMTTTNITPLEVPECNLHRRSHGDIKIGPSCGKQIDKLKRKKGLAAESSQTEVHVSRIPHFGQQANNSYQNCCHNAVHLYPQLFFAILSHNDRHTCGWKLEQSKTTPSAIQ